MISRSNKLFSAALLAGIGILSGIVFLYTPLQEWEERLVDFKLQIRPRIPAPDDVGLVLVDDTDLAEPNLGPWPISRFAHSDLIAILRALGVSHTSFDIVFSEPSDMAADDAFTARLEESPDVTLAYYFENFGSSAFLPESEDSDHFSDGYRFGIDVVSSDIPTGYKPIPIFRPIQVSTGAVNVAAEAGNSVFRRLPMLIRHKDKLYPGLVLETLISMYELEPDQIRVEAGRKIELVGTPQGTLSIPIDDRLRYRVNFRSGTQDFVPVFSYLDLYAGVEDSSQANLLKEALSGKPVLVGNATTGSSDIVTTPIGRLPGVLAHTTALANILEGNHLRFLSPLLILAWCALAGLILAIILRGASAWRTILGGLLFAVLYCVGNYFAAVQDWMLPLVPILLLNLVGIVGFLWMQIHQASDDRERTLRALGKYVSPSIAHRALREEAFIHAPNERREVTIFFSDIRGFTDWSERNEPEVVTDTLNEYLEAMIEVVDEYGATLDKFVGDCVMVLFNAPEPMEDHAERAVRMAWEMQKRLDELNEGWKSKGQEPIAVGMGLHTGFATIGNFGSDRYSDYTAIGNSVNLTARIENTSKPGQILLSEKTQLLVSELITHRSLGEFQLKGIQSPVPLFEMTGWKSQSSEEVESEP